MDERPAILCKTQVAYNKHTPSGIDVHCVGQVLSGGGLSLSEIVISILIGYGLICVYMIFIGMQACDTGLPVAVMASGALGEKGARYVISTLIAIACIGWFGIQSATCGQAFATMIAPLLGMEASR